VSISTFFERNVSKFSVFSKLDSKHVTLAGIPGDAVYIVFSKLVSNVLTGIQIDSV
jgi:hypothetical protein